MSLLLALQTVAPPDPDTPPGGGDFRLFTPAPRDPFDADLDALLVALLLAA